MWRQTGKDTKLRMCCWNTNVPKYSLHSICIHNLTLLCTFTPVWCMKLKVEQESNKFHCAKIMQSLHMLLTFHNKSLFIYLFMHLSKGPLVLVSLIDKFRNCVFHHRDIQSDVGHAGLVHDNTHRHNNSCQGQWRRFEHCVPPRKNILQRSAWHRQSRAQCGVERVRGNVRWRVVWLLESSACETLISANNTTTTTQCVTSAVIDWLVSIVAD